VLDVFKSKHADTNKMKIIKITCLFIVTLILQFIFQSCASSSKTERIDYCIETPVNYPVQEISISGCGNYFTNQVFKIDVHIQNNSSKDIFIDPLNIYLMDSRNVVLKKLTIDQTVDLVLLEYESVGERNIRTALLGRFLEVAIIPPGATIEGMLTWYGSNLNFPLWFRMKIGNETVTCKIKKDNNQTLNK
jgi:hypothetical protein